MQAKLAQIGSDKRISVFFVGLLPIAVGIYLLLKQYKYNGAVGTWTVYDWLTNYQGGFTRRGFAGEIIYLISSFTHISPLDILFAFQIFLIGSLYYNISKIILLQQDITRHLIVMFSPAFFVSFLNDNTLGRKDTLYFAVMSYLVRFYLENKLSKAKEIAYFFIVYPAIILTHEVFFALLPYSLVFIKDKKKTILYSMPSVLTFALIIISHKLTSHAQAKAQVEAIISSYHKFGIYLANAGALNWLEFNSKQGFQYVEYYYFRHFIWVLYVVLWAINVAILVWFYKKRFTKRIVFYSLLSVLLMIPVFIVAIDWARFITFECMSLWFVLLTDANETSELFQKLDNIFINKIANPFILAAVIWVYGGIVGIGIYPTFPNASFGYLTNILYTSIYKDDPTYKLFMSRMQIGCKVVKCPSNYPQKLKEGLALIHENKKLKLDELEPIYLGACFIRPNPYLDYKTAEAYCYKIAKRILKVLTLNQK